MDEGNLPTDKNGREVVLLGACKVLEDVLDEVYGQGLTAVQVIDLIQKKVKKIQEMLDE